MSIHVTPVTTTVTTTCRRRLKLSTDDIEDYLRSRFEKDGWKVSFDWDPGYWPSLTVTQVREEVSTSETSEP